MVFSTQMKTISKREREAQGTTKSSISFLNT